MASHRPFAPALVAALCGVHLSHAQPTGPAEFEAVSITRHVATDVGTSVRTLPGGTTVLTNVSISMALSMASPLALRHVTGLPDWANAERYDITATAPAGASRDKESAMWRGAFADRMKLVAHEEQREKDVLALVLARQEGRLGPQLVPSILDCSPAARNAVTPGQPPFTVQYLLRRCLIGALGNTLASGGVTMDQLALFLSVPAGGEVMDHTGLQGRYAFTLTFSRQRAAGPSSDAIVGDGLPDIFTAVQEQLGLKLQHVKKTTQVFVVDHIERPSEN
jgi:uncharacterized protein (TIGR03435 family)